MKELFGVMRIHHALIVAVISLAAGSCAAPRPPVSAPRTTSVHELLASPRQFDGDRVIVKGFFLMPMVGDLVLYDTEDDYRRHKDRAIRVDMDPSKTSVMPFQVKMCLVEGRFHARRGGAARASVEEITHMELVH